MCDPVSLAIASFATTATSAVAGHVGQARSARAQADAIRSNYAERQAALDAQQMEIAQSGTQQMSQRALAAIRERGRLTAALADSGLAGASHSRLFGDVGMAEATDMATLQASSASALAQAQRNKRATSSGALGELSAIRTPSLLGTTLQIAGAGLDSYTRYQQTNPQNKAPTNKAR